MQKDESNTLRNHFYLLSIILILIELSALIAKLIFKTDSYSAKINLTNTKEISSVNVEREMLLAKLQKYQTLTSDNDLDIMEDFYSKAKDINDDKLDALLQEWKLNKKGTFGGYWRAFEEKFLVQR